MTGKQHLMLVKNIQQDTGIKVSNGEVYAPVYNQELMGMQECFAICLRVSRQIWTYLGYSGLIDPWHDDVDPRLLFNVQQKSFLSLMEFLQETDMDLEAYCILTCLISDYSQWERPALLYCGKTYKAWMKKFRSHTKTKERFKETADFMLKFVELQVEYHKVSNVKIGNIVGLDSAELKCLVTYHRISDRLKQFEAQGVKWEDWLIIKYKKCAELLKKGEMVYLKSVVNPNSLDPVVEDVKAKSDDPWREMREFLNLSDECQFPDGYIPKGWVPANDDFADTSKIACIRGDGFYFYPNGEQRRGKRHYAGNTYLGIKCTPENFSRFRVDWRSTSMLTAKPTWEEYREFAITPGKWDEEGNPDRPYGKPVKWRKK